MAGSNIVFLIDVNAFPRRKVKAEPHTDNQNTTKLEGGNERSESGHSQQETIPALPFDDCSSPDPSDGDLHCLKTFILLTLYKEASTGTDYDFGRVQWSFKFFDSSRRVDFRDGRAFMPFDHDSFSNFENQVYQRLGKPTTDSELLISRCGTAVKYLSEAIKIITGSLQWPESQSADMSTRSFNSGESPVAHNMVVVLLKVPKSDREYLEYSDLHANSSTKDFMNMLLPSAFSNRFHHKLRIQLTFVDTAGGASPENWRSSETKWDRIPYPRQIVRCLQYLGNGKIMKIPDYSSLVSVPLAFGLIPYSIHLRTLLQQKTVQNENVPSHIMRLAPTGTKCTQKVSPDFESSSVGRSLSILELSNNSQSLSQGRMRPLRVSSGIGDDYDHSEFQRRRVTSMKPHDRLMMVGDRKRKRLDYDAADDYYTRPDRRSGNHDMDYDSVDTDSQCEKELRLESWINEGNFINKRQKHVDATTSAVPMSRPLLNKSAPVFHEPAPKLSRGKKMLATVERQKSKVTAVESKRLSSEGMDLKRIAQMQEKELSAIKRRLKIHLEGELDDEIDPISWQKNFKKQLRSFADGILGMDNPCLVALAQALVNVASVQFTFDRMDKMKAAYGNNGLTAKDFLEDLLLIEFKNLNKKIITAHECESSDPNKYSKLKVGRLMAFREAELQIILRLEIEWCFVEPDEDATEDVLVEIVRLLNIIAAYRAKPSISHFINSVLLPTYRQSSRFMKDLYKRMNIPLPSLLLADGSPLAVSSRRDDDSSMISSTSSANLYPEDSASQLHLYQPKRPQRKHRQSPSTSKSRSFGHYSGNGSGRKINTTAPKSIRRQILVGGSHPKQLSSQFAMDKSHSLKKTDATKVSPKRVRRNLFDVQKSDKKDSKALLALSAKVSKSPAFKSPRGKSPMSGSGFFRAARSRRQFTMHSESGSQKFASPGPGAVDSDVLCPESPATPHSRYAGSRNSGGSVDKTKSIIQESPEIQKSDYNNRQTVKVSSLSFYSTGNEASKSRAWEKSGTQLAAARIKDSVNIRSRDNMDLTLTLNDLEMLHQSKSPDVHSTSNISGTNMSICENSYVESKASPTASTSQSLHHFTGPAPDLDNPNIEALITSETFPIPMMSKDTKEVTLKITQQEPCGSPSASVTASPSNLQTPSKRVQFNLNENLVNTPSSVRRTGTGTPKSILKEERVHDVA